MRICPKCKSRSVQAQNTRGLNAIANVAPVYTCDDCGFSGFVFPEVDDDD